MATLSAPRSLMASPLPETPKTTMQEGTFCFQITNVEGLQVYYDPPGTTNSPPRYMVQRYELVEVDQIVRTNDHCLSLRLADHSGWIWAKNSQLHQVPLQTGLWSWYVDNFPAGITVRRHPLDAAALLPTEHTLQRLWPLQQIFCDCRVVHPDTGVIFYRLQTTGGWVYDRTPLGKEAFVWWLLPTDRVQQGRTWVYQTLHEDLLVRATPTVTLQGNEEWRIPQGDMVAVQCIREDNSSNLTKSGPFLQLTDGSGWLLEYRHETRVMEPIPVIQGYWECRVLNEPVGLGLRRNPMDGQEQLVEDVVYPSRSILQCDLRVTNPQTGVSFYRVHGTDGWLFDRREDTRMLEILSSRCRDVGPAPEDAWTVDFVRGIAATVEGLKESIYHEKSKVLSFKAAENVEINVFLATHTVGRVFDHPILKRQVHSCQRGCTPQELWSFFKKDAVELMTSVFSEEEDCKEEKKEECEESKEKVGSLDERNSLVLEREVEVRKELVELDQKIDELRAKRREMVHQVTIFDEQRARAAREVVDKVADLPLITSETDLEEQGEYEEREVEDHESADSSSEDDEDYDDDDDDDDDASSQSSDSRTDISGTIVSSKSTGLSRLSSSDIHCITTGGSSRIDGLTQAVSDVSSGSISTKGNALTVTTAEALEKQNVEVDYLTSLQMSPRSTRSVRSPRMSVCTEENEGLVIASVCSSRRGMQQHFCSECKKGFGGKYSRDIHCREVHNLFCPECDKIYPSRKELEQHRDHEKHW